MSYKFDQSTNTFKHIDDGDTSCTATLYLNGLPKEHHIYHEVWIAEECIDEIVSRVVKSLKEDI